MRSATKLGLVLFGATALFVGCSGNDTNNSHGGTAGTGVSGGAAGGSAAGAGGTSAGTGFGAGSGGTAGTGGPGGELAGGGGVAGMSGAATTAGTAGVGGTPPVIVPTVVVLDNVRLAPQGSFPDNNAGGAGGGDAGGAGGAADGVIDVPAAGGAGGAGGANAGPLPDFFEPFDASLGTFQIHPDGFSPSVGGTTGPVIFDKTTLLFDATAGKSGGGAKISVPFSVKGQQADFARLFDAPVDLTGYEFTADVKLTEEGDIKGCISAWLYTWGGGYANDASGEPAAGTTLHLVKGQWTKIKLRMDGPYGVHSTANFPTFKPTQVVHWGVQLNTFGCP